MSKVKLSIIVAVDEKNGIGKNNQMSWHISEDFKRFKEKTTGHPIIMGRKTWESLPVKPLPDRYNIIVTRDPEFKISFGNAQDKQDLRIGDNFSIVSSLEEAIDVAKKQNGSEEIFIIGGGQIFGQAIKLADKLYITKVKGDYDSDAFFPDYSNFKKVIFEKKSKEGNYEYTFFELEK